jgi:predicted DNA-binding mobile mystery protein A
MRAKGWEERLRELDEMAMALYVARGVAIDIQGKAGAQGKADGWLRTVRRAVGIPVAEAAGRMGVVKSDLYRMEYAEGQGVIGLQTLRRAAEALGCELVYGLVPKEGTLAKMAAAIETGRAQRRTEAWARKLQKAKDQRREAAKLRWRTHEKERLKRQWAEYWKRWNRSTPIGRRSIPKPGAEVKFWKVQMRKALKNSMRKVGVMVR